MLPTLARKAAQSQPGGLLRRRLRHCGLDGKRKRWLARNLGENIGQIYPKQLQPCPQPVTSASGFDLLCSYSWRVEPKKQRHTQPPTQPGRAPARRPVRPQIYVPGEAHVVLQRELPLAVTTSSKARHHRDANLARMPSCPFEPMFQSLSVLNPGFRCHDLDLIVNRNSLNRLLRFVSGSAKESFRLDLAMVHNTLIVTPVLKRVIESAREEANHGRDFEDLFLHGRLRDSATYHRAIRYDLGPLNCAVLSEIDAALPCSGEAMASHDTQWKFHPGPAIVAPSELSDQCQPDTRAEEILFGPQDPTAFNKPILSHQPSSEVLPGGTGTFSKDAAELYAGADGIGTKKMPQLWFGRVPFLVHGRYRGGSFTSVDVFQVATRFPAYEQRIQIRLQKMVSLIGRLAEFAKNATDQRCVALCDKTMSPRALSIFNHHKTPPPPLPADVLRHFWPSKETGDQGSQ